MTGSATYPYASGNLLVSRNTYFYSAYGGHAFLDGWMAQRGGVLAALPSAAREAPASLGPAEAPGAEGAETARLLEYLLRALGASRGSIPEDVAAWLARMIQRFEVTKRIHDAYGPDFRARDREAYRAIRLYLRFAEVVEDAYRCGGSLPCLNALLKCLDTLSALHFELDAGEAARLARLILAERRHVADLAARLGVAW